MKARVLYLSILIAALPLLAEAAGAPRTFRELAKQIVDLLTAAAATLVFMSLVIFMYGIARNLTKLGENETGAYRDFVFWGVIILFVMVSIWGILRLIQNTVFQGSGNQNITMISHYVT